MKQLFKKDIYDWNAWGTIYQSIDDFQELIEGIFNKENLSRPRSISHLTPGTNAVFKADNYVIKIFAPDEAGVDSLHDYDAEMIVMQRAIAADIATPNIIKSSSIQDKYLFRYFIMEFIEGNNAGDVLIHYNHQQKINFVQKLMENLIKINSKPVEKVKDFLIIEKAKNNERWNKFSNPIRMQIRKIIDEYNPSEFVYVHGDITADNIIIDNDERLFIIDFADSTIAPREYEFPTIIFDLFNFDLKLIREFMKGVDDQDFIEKLFIGTLIHEFGANFVELIYQKYIDKSIANYKDINEIKEILYKIT